MFIIYSGNYTDAIIQGGVGMLLIGLIALALGMTAISLRWTFPLLKLLAGVCWWVLAFYIKENPPGSLTEGSSVHTMLFIALLGLGIAIPVIALYNESRRTRRTSMANGFDVSEELTEGGWHLPEWMQSPESKQREEQHRRAVDDDNYREQFRRALNPKDRKGRR